MNIKPENLNPEQKKAVETTEETAAATEAVDPNHGGLTVAYVLLAAAALFCVPRAVEGMKRLAARSRTVLLIASAALLIFSLAALVRASYNPFLYFRF